MSDDVARRVPAPSSASSRRSFGGAGAADGRCLVPEASARVRSVAMVLRLRAVAEAAAQLLRIRPLGWAHASQLGSPSSPCPPSPPPAPPEGEGDFDSGDELNQLMDRVEAESAAASSSTAAASSSSAAPRVQPAQRALLAVLGGVFEGDAPSGGGAPPVRCAWKTPPPPLQQLRRRRCSSSAASPAAAPPLPRHARCSPLLRPTRSPTREPHHSELSMIR